MKFSKFDFDPTALKGALKCAVMHTRAMDNGHLADIAELLQDASNELRADDMRESSAAIYLDALAECFSSAQYSVPETSVDPITLTRRPVELLC